MYSMSHEPCDKFINTDSIINASLQYECTIDWHWYEQM